MKKTSADSRSTIVVTVDVAANLGRTLDLALRIAASRRSSIHGLYVVDEDLLAVSRLPFSQEVPRFGGRSRHFSSEELERSINRRSDEFRSALEREAGQLSLAWSYASVRGSKRAVGLEHDTGAGLLIIGQPVGQRRRSAAAHALQILFFPAPDVAASPGLETVLEACGSLPVELTMAYVGMPAAAGAPEEEFFKAHPNITRRAMQQQEALSRLGSRQLSPDYVVVSHQAGTPVLDACLRLAACPLIVVP